jgi:hypothetical protein
MALQAQTARAQHIGRYGIEKQAVNSIAGSALLASRT